MVDLQKFHSTSNKKLSLSNFFTIWQSDRNYNFLLTSVGHAHTHKKTELTQIQFLKSELNSHSNSKSLYLKFVV